MGQSGATVSGGKYMFPWTSEIKFVFNLFCGCAPPVPFAFAVCFVECIEISVVRMYVCVWCVVFIAPCFQRNVAVST